MLHSPAIKQANESLSFIRTGERPIAMNDEGIEAHLGDLNDAEQIQTNRYQKALIASQGLGPDEDRRSHARAVRFSSENLGQGARPGSCGLPQAGPTLRRPRAWASQAAGSARPRTRLPGWGVPLRARKTRHSHVCHPLWCG